jgi:exopolysaccharide biosynthesis protein
LYRGTDVRWAEWPIELGERRLPVKIVVVEVDPQRVQLELAIAREGNTLAAWSLDNTPPDAVLSMNAGQFTDEGPWGWVVHNGREWQQPGRGSLAGAITIDSTGRVRIIDASEIESARETRAVREALQSYPLILRNNRAPSALCVAASIDQTHRDVRLVLATRPDGRVMLLLSRFDGIAGLASRLPLGPTTAEMTEVAWRLGAEHALMLDGGLSAQLMVRDSTKEQRWHGLRRVPLALIGRIKRPIPSRNPSP